MAEWLRRLKYRLRVARALDEIKSRDIVAEPHRLGKPVIISLTSYPARFSTLAVTLQALLGQTVQADRTILWLARGEDAALPPDVLTLQERGLEIRADCEQIRSYKKIIPALEAFPDAYIATADDDLYYRADWLAGLTAHAKPGCIVAHRAHLIRRTQAGLAPYADWRKNISGDVEGPDVFVTSGGGALYSPGSLHPDVVRENLFMRLCPTADDVWLWWMARRAGSMVRHVGPRMRIIEWPGSQTTNLREANIGPAAGNDQAIAAMIAHFGIPPG